MLRHRIRYRPRKFSKTFGLDKDGVGSGPEGRLRRMKKVVGALFRYERIESTYARCDEARGYAERLIGIAMKNGDQHQPTMDMCNYWLEEKDLIHKLFKVLVPRYRDYYRTTFTDMKNIPTIYPGDGRKMVVLELKGNPYPPVVPHETQTKGWLTNVLLDSARHETLRGTAKKEVHDLLTEENPDDQNKTELASTDNVSPGSVNGKDSVSSVSVSTEDSMSSGSVSDSVSSGNVNREDTSVKDGDNNIVSDLEDLSITDKDKKT